MGEIDERRIENANDWGHEGAELIRSPDNLMPELFLECTAYVMQEYAIYR